MNNTENSSDATWLPTSQSRLHYLHFNEIALHGSVDERTALALRILRDADALATVRAELNRAANSLAAVMRLPAEILLAIFALVFSEEIPTPPLHRKNVASNGWGSISEGPFGSLGCFRLLHICSSWRSLIENTPSLWAQHVYRLPAATTSVLERSQDLPLHIEIAPPDVTSSLCGCCQSIEPHTLAERTRSLCWKVNHAEDLPSLTKFFAHTAMPVLWRAEIQYEYDTVPYDYRTLGIIDAPQLQHLCMHNLIIPFRSTALTYLQLENIQPSEEELLEVLQRYPSLETLVLQSCFIDGTHDTAPFHVELNRLKVLKIEEGQQYRFDTVFIITPQNYTPFMRRLHLPHTTAYSISLNSEDPEMIPDDLGLLSPILQSIQKSEPVIGIDYNDLTLSLHTSVGDLHPEYYPQLHGFFTFEDDSRCSYEYLTSLGAFARFLDQPQSQQDFRHITVLTVSCYDAAITANEWLFLARALPNLRVLHAGTDTPHLIPTVVTVLPTGDGVLLPELRHFGIWGDGANRNVDEQTLSALVVHLEARNVFESDGLASLCIGQLSDPRLKRDFAPRLALYAEYVVWTGDPDSVSSSSSPEPSVEGGSS